MYWKSHDESEIRANGAVCPMPGCGAVVVAYQAINSVNDLSARYGGGCEFVCPQCGFEFTATGNDMIFKSIPRDWLLSEVCHA
jgi:hypothetical protein